MNDSDKTDHGDTAAAQDRTGQAHTGQGRAEQEWPAGQGNADEEIVPVDNLLGLKLLVVSLGVLLIVAAITFILLLVLKKDEEPAPPPVVSSYESGEDVPFSTLVLAEDEEIIGMSLNGRSLALRLATPEGERILIVDPYTSDHRAVIEIARDGIVTGE